MKHKTLKNEDDHIFDDDSSEDDSEEDGKLPEFGA